MLADPFRFREVKRRYLPVQMMRLLSKLFLLMAVSYSPAIYASCSPWIPDEVLPSSLTIGSIEIDNGDVFDTSDENENAWLHRTVNTLHIKTRTQVIRRLLLFEEGDPYTQRLIDETERLLRSNRYIRTARIIPVNVCDNQIDLRVITTDSWTLTPGISFGRSGGVNTTNLDIEEHNLLGYGKGLSFNRKDNNERIENSLFYEDKNIFGSRNRLSLGYQDNSDGNGSSFSIGLPFYHFGGLHAWNISASSLVKENLIYDQGEAIDSLGREKTNFSSYYAWADSLSLISVNRYKVGWSYSADSSFSTEQSPSLELPEDTVYSSPFIGWQYLQQRFVTRRNLFGVEVTEDISLGEDANIEMG